MATAKTPKAAPVKTAAAKPAAAKAAAVTKPAEEAVSGTLITFEEDQKMERVALIGQSTVNNLFGIDSKENPVGKFIKINRINFQIIGILPIKGSTGFRDQDDTIVMPLDTADPAPVKSAGLPISQMAVRISGRVRVGIFSLRAARSAVGAGEGVS